MILGFLYFLNSCVQSIPLTANTGWLNEDLLAFITGQDFEDEDDGSLVTAASLGEVKLSKGWTATMLEMPKKFVVKEGGARVNYYTAHATERLKKQEDTEKLFFGGPLISFRNNCH